MSLVLTDILLFVANFLNVLIKLQDISKLFHILGFQFFLSKVNLLYLSENASELCDKSDSIHEVAVLHIKVKPTILVQLFHE